MRMRNVSTRIYEGSIKRKHMLSCHAHLTRDKKKDISVYKLDKHFSTKFNKYILFDSQHMTCMSIFFLKKKWGKKSGRIFHTASIMEGYGVLDVVALGEEYEFTFPSYYVRGLLIGLCKAAPHVSS
jgi:hypothetical protein